LPTARPRISSIDAFRGLTILMMIFVIRVAGYPDLPLTFPHFGSSPVSTFKHADSESAAGWALYEHGTTSSIPSKHWRGGQVVGVDDGGLYDIRLIEIAGGNGQPNPASLRSKGSVWRPVHDGSMVTATAVRVHTPKPLRVGDGVVVHLPDGGDSWNGLFRPGAGERADMDRRPVFQAPKIGCTFTDLVAPFFVFIVGVVIPIGRAHREPGWLLHALKRCLFLIAAGVVYLSLIGALGLSWWWGILQAIGVAYLMGVILYQLPPALRLGVLLAVAAGHEGMTRLFHWWTELGDPDKAFMSLANWNKVRDMDPLRPLELHCTPWASIGYGICTVLGTFIGDAIRTRSGIARTCLMVGVGGVVVGLMMNATLFPMHKEFVTVSYAVFTSGIASLTYLAIFHVMDVVGWKLWAWPLEVFGQNALFAYFSQVLVGGILLERFGLSVFFSTVPFVEGHALHNAAWLMKAGINGVIWGVVYTFVLWLATLVANRRGWFWKL
jgi:predicted acyltransferase